MLTEDERRPSRWPGSSRVQVACSLHCYCRSAKAVCVESLDRRVRLIGKKRQYLIVGPIERLFSREMRSFTTEGYAFIR